MSQITVKSFAEQIDVGVDKLIQQLADAGISGKNSGDQLTDEEYDRSANSMRPIKRGLVFPSSSRSAITPKKRSSMHLKRA